MSVATGLMRSPSTGTVDTPHSARVCRVRSGRNPDGVLPAGGLRMSSGNESERGESFAHTPVMRDEVVALFANVPRGYVIDCTVGGGGHSAAILEAHPHLSVLGLDQDEEAAIAASERLRSFGARAVVVQARSDELQRVVEEHVGDNDVAGVLLDLGVSSHQLDAGLRGFSYRSDAPLDMRMNRRSSFTAADVVNTYDHGRLARLFADNGERKFAGRIASAILASRPIETTAQLAEVVKSAIPAATRRHGGHPAKRVFQAIRIEVNDELAVLERTLDAALAVLGAGGRCVVLSYHSGEDRRVKERFLTASTGGCVCPPGLPCGCGAVPEVRLLNRGSRKPSAAEVAANPRAESARLRAVEKLHTAGSRRPAIAPEEQP